MSLRKITLRVFLITLLSSAAEAAAVDTLNTALRGLAGAIALLMILFQGVRWVISESDKERADAKKGIVYVLVGLLIVSLAYALVCTLYANTIESYGDVSCSCGLLSVSCV